MGFKSAFFYVSFFLLLLGTHCIDVPAKTPDSEPLRIVLPQDASYMETLAANEICRYVYLRTGALASIVTEPPSSVDSDSIVITRKDRSLASNLGVELQAQQYLLKTTNHDAKKQVWIVGGDDAGTLYGAYRFAERLGVRFYLHGDVIPDQRIALQLPDLDETGKPLFETRGIQPFHDFPEGPDWWNEDEYKAILSQLPKLRMNFFGLHTYPEERPNAEPTVWIGLEKDAASDGNVRFSYPSSYQNTLRGNWGYVAKKTIDYTFGAADLFEFDVYGPDVMGTSLPSPDTPEKSNSVFDRTARMLREAFTHARRLGVKTCVGTETPLIIPKKLQERLKQLGKDPASPSVVRELYEGIFKRIIATYPIDYYWFWTPEGWIWEGVEEDKVLATKNDLLTAIQAAQNVDVPFTLATCGWVLGPQTDRSLFDRTLPKDMPMSCINREVGKAPVETSFQKIKGRPLWAIPWLEDDPALLNSQLWVGRMRADAVDALNYGCTGLLGIHWRTRILAPNISALASAAWEQGDWGQLEASPAARFNGPMDGQFVSWSDKEIAGTEDDDLYQTGRENVSAYHFAVTNGTYSVTLKFRTIQKSCMFGVSVQGNSVIPKLNLNQNSTEECKAVDYTFSTIDVENGWLDIEFSPMVGAPVICAISLESQTLVKRINCGGPAYNDYKADWPSSPVKPRHLASKDFYLDWARAAFGGEVAESVAYVFASIDGKFPCPSDWIDGPGGLAPDKRSWSESQKDYEFLKKFESLDAKIASQGNRERFNYWLNNFRFMRYLAETRCLWGEFDKLIEEQAKKETNADVRKKFVHDKILPLVKQTIETFGKAYKTLLPTVSNTGELGTICNLEQHVKDLLITRTEKRLSELSGDSISLDKSLSKDYDGPPTLIVPTVRTSVMRGEPFFLKVILLDRYAPRDAALYWREMGKGKFQRVPLIHLRRGVYKVEFPAEATAISHLEYYVQVRSGSGKLLHFPATAPELNQTVVVMQE